jgi:hypothetical protein
MDPASPYGDTGRTVKDRIGQLVQQYTAVNELAQRVEALQQTMSAQDWISYLDRSRTFGEVASARWLLGKYGQQRIHRKLDLPKQSWSTGWFGSRRVVPLLEQILPFACPI